MKIRVAPRITAIAICLALLLFGGIAYAENASSAWDATPELIFTTGGHALPADIIDTRIDMYEELLAGGALSADTRETVESLLVDYGKIKTALEGDVSEEYYHEITHILFDSVRMLEEKYLKGTMAASDKPQSETPNSNLQMQGPPGGEPQEPAKTGAPGPAIPPPMMESMAAGIEGLLSDNSISDDARETAIALLACYRKIQTALATDISEEYYREITHQLFDGMLLLENGFVVSGQAPSPATEVLTVEEKWIRAFNALDFDLMASLYRHSPETTSYSPNSGVLYQGWDTISEGLKKYFNSPQGTYSWTLNDEKVTMLSDDMAIILGNHVVVDRPENGQEMTGTHVFTRVVQKIEGEWRIIHEHESHIPRKQS